MDPNPRGTALDVAAHCKLEEACIGGNVAGILCKGCHVLIHPWDLGESFSLCCSSPSTINTSLFVWAVFSSLNFTKFSKLSITSKH